MVGFMTQTVGRVFDRTDPTIKARQDALINVALFGLAVWAIHTYGHKLAV